jgi:putative ABC transport system substrate-binding protein
VGGGTKPSDRISLGAADIRRFRAYAVELVGLKLDVIVTNTTPALAELQRATRTIPIVFVQISDPVSAGFVASLARPGGNMTGFSNFEYAIGGKWLQVLKEISPGIVHVGVVLNPEDPSGPRYLRTIELEGPSSGVQVTTLAAPDVTQMERSIDLFTREAAGGLIVLPSPVMSSNRDRIVARAIHHRLPAVYPLRYFATAGGLVSYGVDPDDLHRRAASYVDRILNGASPADLPVQQPTKYELVINVKTAKILGIDIPPTVLARADEVIE